MKSSRAQRWDLVIGALASLVAVAGLLLSLAVGNTKSIGVGSITLETQRFMLWLAVVSLMLVGIKFGMRYRDGGACRLNIRRWFNANRLSR